MNSADTSISRGGRGACASRAFSLIETVVVVGIVSILVGIVGISMASAGRLARIYSCQTGLRTLATAMLTYAGSNGGDLPPGPIEREYWAGDPDRGSPFEVYDSHRILDAGLSSRDGWYGFGLLWKSGYVDDGHAYYCPSAKDKGGIGYDQAWPRAFDAYRNPADGKSRIFSTYVYRGGLSSHAGGPNGPLSLCRNPGTLGILADNPCSSRMWHDGGYNVVFLNSSIDFVAFDDPPVSSGHLQDLWQAINAFWQ